MKMYTVTLSEEEMDRLRNAINCAIDDLTAAQESNSMRPFIQVIATEKNHYHDLTFKLMGAEASDAT